MIDGILKSANNIADVRIPMTPREIPMRPAAYSFWKHASNPNISASGLNNGERIKTPMNPKMILREP